ncbi:hypothetical protein D3C76_774760 [compost metagenome]
MAEDCLVSTETRNGFVLFGEQVELGVGVIKHLLITGAVAAEPSTVPGEFATGHH